MLPKQFFAKAAITLAAAAAFFLIRPDTLLFARAEHQRLLGSSQLIAEYLRTTQVKKLQIGAGKHNMDGWLNTDIDMRTEEASKQAYLDATEKFPLPDRSFRYIYGEHVFEHLPFPQGIFMLKESYRILEPGGRIRLATPNLNKFLALFREDQTPEMKEYIKEKLQWHEWPELPDNECFILNMQLREWGHQFVYTPKMLRAVLENVGFREVKEYPVSQSDDPALRGLEVRASWKAAKANVYETMIFEAVKPQ
ncbi:MAG: methyltransferase domain-containing protein [Bryobacteraceae bacterium]|nr:methyltransferase domain-containing protein [Bryobacteraceae bacterium]